MKNNSNFKARFMTTALAGLNGDNQTSISFSNSISLSFQGMDKNNIKIRFIQPAEFYIQKNHQPNIIFLNYHTNEILELMKNKSSTSNLFYQSFKLSGSNLSIHFQIKPNISSVGYLTLLKYGGLPTFEKNNYDFMNFFCPEGKLNNNFYINKKSSSIALRLFLK